MENNNVEPLLNEANDFNNPPLRRIRTSLVSRQRMENIAQLDSSRKFLKEILSTGFWYTLTIAYLCACYYVPEIQGSARDPECEMKAGYFNAMFGMYCLGAQVLFRFLFVIGYCFKRCCSNISRVTEYVQQGVIVVGIADAVVIFIGWTIFFYWSQTLWSDVGSSSSCTQGRNLWDFVNWILILGMTVWPAILMTILLCVGLCCLPCIITSLKEYCRASREEQREKFAVLDGLIKTKYNPDDFKAHKDCAICFCEFGSDDQVSPLPCNSNHYFHSECIQTWIKENPSCPMCREEITPDKLEEFSKGFDKRLTNEFDDEADF